jgi:hypothetical protein
MISGFVAGLMVPLGALPIDQKRHRNDRNGWVESGLRNRISAICFIQPNPDADLGWSLPG